MLCMKRESTIWGWRKYFGNCRFPVFYAIRKKYIFSRLQIGLFLFYFFMENHILLQDFPFILKSFINISLDQDQKCCLSAKIFREFPISLY